MEDYETTTITAETCNNHE